MLQAGSTYNAKVTLKKKNTHTKTEKTWENRVYDASEGTEYVVETLIWGPMSCSHVIIKNDVHRNK